VAEGDKAFAKARALADRLKTLRTQAFTKFDTRDREGGERVWAEARATSESFDASLEAAQRALAAALEMDRSRAEIRGRLAEVLFERAELAELEFRRDDVTRHVATLEVVDTSGEQLRRWRQPGALSLNTDPPGARLSLERFETTGGDRIAAVAIASNLSSPVVDRSLPPGSYRLHIETSGRTDAWYPFVITRGEKVTAAVALPSLSETPADFRYVPAGRFLYGDQDEEWRLSFLNAVPLHQRELPAFFIKSHETTFGEWIEFLESLPPKERAAHLPFSKAVQGTVALTEVANGKWKLHLDISKRPLEAKLGQPIVYPGRPADAATQDWLKMPVLAISTQDIRAYLGWLSTTGKVPGARLCREVEWERAARGADERAYPTSLRRLVAGEVNVDTTYGRISGAYGPDEVGRHPQSRSPFGLHDMAGNAWEVVESDEVAAGVLERGGGYYHQPHNARLTNREPIDIESRSHHLGFRVCADVRSR
jgi:eukaryotic-like serine/threonine-protein kinase